VDPSTEHRATEHLRVLIANERKDRLALVATVVVALGHEVIAREVDVDDVGPVTARERPDVALVGLGESSEHALELIEKIVREAACPVIVLLHHPDPKFVKEASKRGVFAHISDADVEDWQSSIDIVLRRFAEYHNLQGAFGRHVITEPQASSWNATPSTRKTPPRYCASTHASPTANSLTSPPPPSSTATTSSPNTRPPPRRPNARTPSQSDTYQPVGLPRAARRVRHSRPLTGVSSCSASPAAFSEPAGPRSGVQLRR
jgi:chemotaxis response regulator CheB